MALRFDVIHRYTDTPWLVVIVTAVLVFFDEIASAYHTSLIRSLSRLEMLSPEEWVALSISSFIVEPVLLFVSLYYVSRYLEERLPVVVLLPSLTLAVIVGCFLGQFVGGSIWNVNTPLFTALQRNMLLPSPLALVHWQEFAEPFVRSLLTAVAALGIAHYRS